MSDEMIIVLFMFLLVTVSSSVALYILLDPFEKSKEVPPSTTTRKPVKSGSAGGTSANVDGDAGVGTAGNTGNTGAGTTGNTGADTTGNTGNTGAGTTAVTTPAGTSPLCNKWECIDKISYTVSDGVENPEDTTNRYSECKYCPNRWIRREYSPDLLGYNISSDGVTWRNVGYSDMQNVYLPFP